MATSIADTTRDHMLNQIVTDVGTGAYLWIWGGVSSAPAKNAAPTGTNLAKFGPMSNPWGTVASGTLTVSPPTSVPGLASGTPFYYRVTQGGTDTNGSTVVIQGSAGVAVAAPTGLAPTPSGTGGTLAAGTYYYKVTACTALGETTGSSEVTSGALTGSTSSVALAWTAVPGATGYKIYRSTVSGSYASPALIGTVDTTSFTDTGYATLTDAIPAYNSAGGDIAFASTIASGGTVGITSLSYTDGNP